MLPGIGPKTLEKLFRLNIREPIDFLYHFPHRYLDFSNIISIDQLSENNSYTISGILVSFQNIFTRTGKNIQRAKLSDNTGTIDLLWFNQSYIAKKFTVGQRYRFAGKVTKFKNQKTMVSPISGDHQTGKILPIYPETKGLNSTWFRKIISQNINQLLEQINDPIPPSIISLYHLPTLKLALKKIHQPQTNLEITQSRNRIAINETLSLLAQSHILKTSNGLKKANFQFSITPEIQQKIINFIKNLPFKLTDSQKASWLDIQADLLLSKPCNRLLVGDVGTGKTIVAMLASILASENNSTTVILVPTEILAQQHYQTFANLLPKYPIYLLTSNLKLKTNLPPNSIIIATHAILFKKEHLFKQIGLLIIDEQHRFGVSQRSFLANLPSPPHTITLTATPIPRTISLTFLNHLDLSILKLPPAFKLPIKTYLVPPHKITSCYAWLEKQIKSTGQQAFIVCPFIEDSEAMAQVKSAKTEFEKLKAVFPKLKLELIHGQIKPAQREKIFTDFKNKKIDILVTTPIIEVGIDFPNATTIIIQSADRFGLSQLHQLRGRVGRGVDQSYCYLFSESVNEKSLDRLQYLAKHQDGLTIAEYDLKTRGPGEVFSTLQHGFPSLKLADISDIKTVKIAQKIFADLQNLSTFDLKLIASNPDQGFTSTS